MVEDNQVYAFFSREKKLILRVLLILGDAEKNKLD